MKKTIIEGAVIFLYLVGMSACFNYLLPRSVAKESAWVEAKEAAQIEVCSVEDRTPYTDLELGRLGLDGNKYPTPYAYCMRPKRYKWDLTPTFRSAVSAILWPVSFAFILGNAMVQSGGS